MIFCNYSTIVLYCTGTGIFLTPLWVQSAQLVVKTETRLKKQTAQNRESHQWRRTKASNSMQCWATLSAGGQLNSWCSWLVALNITYRTLRYFQAEIQKTVYLADDELENTSEFLELLILPVPLNHLLLLYLPMAVFHFLTEATVTEQGWRVTMRSVSTYELFLWALLRVGLSAPCLAGFSFPFSLCIPFSSLLFSHTCSSLHTSNTPISIYYESSQLFSCMEVFHTRCVDSNRVSSSIAQRAFLLWLALRTAYRKQSPHAAKWKYGPTLLTPRCKNHKCFSYSLTS